MPSIKQPTITPRCDVGIEMTPHGAVYTNRSQELGVYVWSIDSDRIQVDSLKKIQKGINGVKDNMGLRELSRYLHVVSVTSEAPGGLGAR